MYWNTNFNFCFTQKKCKLDLLYRLYGIILKKDNSSKEKVIMEKERRTKALVIVVLLIVVAGLTVAFASFLAS